MKLFKKYIIMLLSTGLMLFWSCTKHPDSPGYEYVPDMYRSQAIEAYVDYGLVGDVEHPELKSKMSARIPAHGTIQYRKNRDLAKIFVPFEYNVGEDERIRAGKEVFIPSYYTSDSVSIASNISEGKRLYGIFCSHCHGNEGKGDGSIANKTDEIVCPDLTKVNNAINEAGSIFHIITYGKGVMGPHLSQLNKDERWKLVMYIRSELKALKNEELPMNVLGDTIEMNDSLSVSMTSVVNNHTN